MKTKKLKIAQIGVGYWGPNLLRNLVSNSRCDLEIVVDISESRRKYVSSLYPEINVSDDENEIFENSSIDAIVISTPVKTHFNLAMKALNSNKHILVEKPMSTKMNEIEKIERVSKKRKLTAMSGHTFLFNSAVNYIKKIIESEDLGKIRYIYSQRLNLGRIRSDVDALWNFAPHDLSIINYWLGNIKPKKINRSGMAYVQKDIEDVSFLNLTYPNDVLVNIHVSWLDPHKIRKMTVVGSKKMIVYDDLGKHKVAIYDKGIDRMAVLGENMDFDKNELYNFNYRSGDVVFPKINWQEPLKKELNHFIDCILEKKKCISDIEHTKSVISILEKS